MLTVPAILASWLAHISIPKLAAEAADLLDGATPEQAEDIVAAMLDDVIPEELFGDRTDEAAEAVYAAAAKALVKLVTKRAREGKAPRRSGLLALFRRASVQP
jgi:uncharacterized protein YicC (UPF0701 family)